MWLMLQQGAPDDYVISTGSTHTVREFLEIAFGYVGLNYRQFVVVDEKFYRPAEVELLLGDCSKAQRALGWHYTHSLQDLVEEMVETDLASARGTTQQFSQRRAA
jgi:GDPmannose 4,6-dehydratase